MFLAEKAIEQTMQFTLFTLHMNVFDIFIIAFTVIIAIGLARLLKSQYRTKFNLGFSSVALLIFLFLDVLMVLSWVNLLQPLQTALFG